MKARRRAIIGWALYDLANTIFFLLVVTRYLPKQLFEITGSESAVSWSLVPTMLVAAILSPALGALVDRAGRAKALTFAITLVCCVATALLGFPKTALGVSLVYVVARFTYEMASVPYNALLPSVAAQAGLGAISGLDSLVEDMLAFGREIEPRRKLQPLRPLVEQALDLARGVLEPRRVRVDVSVEAKAEVDGEMMQRVFLNIIANAAQAVGEGGRLSIAGEGQAIAFADDGPGIAPDILEKIFTPFLTTKTKGTGLGLAIAHKIVEAHGGTIEGKNGPGGGATFTIRL